MRQDWNTERLIGTKADFLRENFVVSYLLPSVTRQPSALGAPACSFFAIPSLLTTRWREAENTDIDTNNPAPSFISHSLKKFELLAYVR